MDTIRGPVLEVIDGGTFEMKVEYKGKNNQHEYNSIECIRIAYINAPELKTTAG